LPVSLSVAMTRAGQLAELSPNLGDGRGQAAA
jgi:hypothetical protein